MIGSGPTGLAAARPPDAPDARVILVDEHSVAGGSLLCETASIGTASAAFTCGVLDELQSLSNVRS